MAQHKRETVSVSGRVVCANGNPAADVTMEANVNDYPQATTDRDGRFSLSVPSNTEFNLAMYEHKTDGSPAKRDGIPYMYNFGETEIGTSDVDLGTLTLPKAHMVSIRFLYADGEPAPSVEPDIMAKHGGSWFGASPSQMRVNRDGYLQISEADYTGVEIGGPVIFSGEFLETGAKYERTFTIDEPKDLVVQAGNGFREVSSTTTTVDPTTTSTTDDRSSSRETTATTSVTTPSRTTPASTTTKQRRRGFFSNDISTGESGTLINDPYFFTVGGFVLSVVGILHQLVGGK